MAAMIGVVCAAHLEPRPEGPVVTTVDGVWAYCLGGGQAEHDWRRVEATPLEELRAVLRHRLREMLDQGALTRPEANSNP